MYPQTRDASIFLCSASSKPPVVTEAVQKKKLLGKRGRAPGGGAKVSKIKKKTSRSGKKLRSEVDEIIRVSNAVVVVFVCVDLFTHYRMPPPSGGRLLTCHLGTLGRISTRPLSALGLDVCTRQDLIPSTAQRSAECS